MVSTMMMSSDDDDDGHDDGADGRRGRRRPLATMAKVATVADDDGDDDDDGCDEDFVRPHPRIAAWGGGGPNAGGGSEPHPKAQCGLACYCAVWLSLLLPPVKLQELSEAHEIVPLR